MRKILFTLYIIAALVSVVSCETNVVYDSYKSVPLAGWEKNDTVAFGFGPVTEAGTYNETVGLRIDNSFPFRSVTLIVEQTVRPHKTGSPHKTGRPHKTVRRDTVRCDLTDDAGILCGDGISRYQYRFALTDLRFMRGDTVDVRIWHGMKREILPGISDIGLAISKLTK